jgi:hypothetical protein
MASLQAWADPVPVLYSVSHHTGHERALSVARCGRGSANTPISRPPQRLAGTAACRPVDARQYRERSD